MTPDCAQLKRDIKELRSLAEEFDTALKRATIEGEGFDEPNRLKAVIEKKKAALKEKLIPQEVRELGIEQQYAEQVKVLEKAGILETLPSGEKGIIGIDGQPYPIPSLAVVMQRVMEKKDILKVKKRQGFVKLVLVPFGMSLGELIEAYGKRLKAHHKQGELNATDGTALELDTSTPVKDWAGWAGADVSGNLVYDPTSFTEENHGGKTKEQLLAAQKTSGDSAPGWRILLLEDLPNLPAEGRGKSFPPEGENARPQLEANKTPDDYRAAIGQTDTPYADESGLAPEDELAYALSELSAENRVIDDFGGAGKACFLTGAWFKDSSYVPYAYWDRVDSRVELDRYHPTFPIPNYSSRSAVRI